MKQLNLIGLILFLFVGLIGCNKETKKPNSEKLCLHLTTENIDKTIPIINNYLGELKSNLDDEEKLESLVEWLKSSSCIIDASVLCISCIETLPTQSEVNFSFKEGEVTKVVILDIIMSNPLKAKICKIQGASNETNVTLKNTESYSRTFLLGDEEGASISEQAKHYEESELIRDESTNFNVEYHYKPTANFIGTDYVILEIHRNSNGVNSTYIELEKINFTITD